MASASTGIFRLCTVFTLVQRDRGQAIQLRVSVTVECPMILCEPARTGEGLKAIFQSQLDHAFGLSESEVAG